MQTLVNTVRATGATNVLMLGGLAYSNSLAQYALALLCMLAVLNLTMSLLLLQMADLHAEYDLKFWLSPNRNLDCLQMTR